MEIENASIVGMLVIFARAIPVFNSIATNVAQLRNGIPIVQELSNLVSKIHAKSTTEFIHEQLPDDNIAIAVRDLMYGIDKPLNCYPINFELHFGEIVGIIGASGSGKSTLIEVLTNLRRPQSGSVIIHPQSEISILTQAGYILHDTLEANLDPSRTSNSSELFAQ